jgi:hypothetical protein
LNELDRIVTRLQEHDRAVRETLAEALLAEIPVIPGVAPLLPGESGKIFTVRSSALSRNTTLSPEYYDASFQVRAVAERIRSAESAARAVAVLKEAAEGADRAFAVNLAGRTSTVLHPAVAEHCAKLLANPPEIRCPDFGAEPPEPGR